MRIVTIAYFSDGKELQEIFLEDGETAPTGGVISTGSRCVDVASGTISIYDESSSSWDEQFSLQD